MRLNRDLRHWEEPMTWRSAIQQIRQEWRECRILLELTAVTFREHLATNLQDLPLDDSQRQQVLGLWRAAPGEAVFWEAVQDALPCVWPISLDTLSSPVA